MRFVPRFVVGSKRIEHRYVAVCGRRWSDVQEQFVRCEQVERREERGELKGGRYNAPLLPITSLDPQAHPEYLARTGLDLWWVKYCRGSP